MTNLLLINSTHKDFLTNLGYKDIEDYIERASNEILFDDVWAWRLKSSIKEDLPFLKEQDYFKVLYFVIKKIISKGGELEDSSNGIGQLLIDRCKKDEKLDISKELSCFLLKYPDYGKDGNGIWISSRRSG